MKEGVRFRSFQESDAKHVPRLFIRAIQSVYPDLEDGSWINDLHDIKNNYGNGGDLLVGEEGNVLVAIGGLKRVNDTIGEMKRVAIDPAKQGQGLGQSLLTALEVRATQLGMKKIILDTTKNQQAARHLYDKNGYTLIDRKPVAHPSGKTFDTFFYEKVLK